MKEIRFQPLRQFKAAGYRKSVSTSVKLSPSIVDRVNLSQKAAKAYKSPISHEWLNSQLISQVQLSGSASQQLVPVLFLSDLDGTWLSPDSTSRRKLDEGVVELQKKARRGGVNLEFGYISARPLQRIQQEKLPTSNFSVAHNGGFIYQADRLDKAWEKHKDQLGFRGDRALEIVKELLSSPEYSNLKVFTVGEVVENPAADDCPQSSTFCIDNGSIKLGPGESLEQLEQRGFKAPLQVQNFADTISAQLEKEGAKFKLSPVYPFHGKPYTMFDLASVDKGDAIDYLVKRESVKFNHLVIAGDGGNDIAMMLNKKGLDDGRRAIVVGDNSSLRRAAENLKRAVIEDPQKDCSQGVLDGLNSHLSNILFEVNAKR